MSDDDYHENVLVIHHDVDTILEAWHSGMHSTLVERHQASFVTDGKHKHGMFTGANIAKLKQSTVRTLVRHEGLNELLRDLTYDWFGFDRGRATNHPDK